tara:strand:- start:144 stop:341 length:198 start_codon:yes stop_codon:yes gene_type:complete
MTKRQLSTYVSEPIYAVISAWASQDKPDKCPACNQKWKPSDEFKGKTLSAITRELIEEAVYNRLR